MSIFARFVSFVIASFVFAIGLCTDPAKHIHSLQPANPRCFASAPEERKYSRHVAIPSMQLDR